MVDFPDVIIRQEIPQFSRRYALCESRILFFVYGLLELRLIFESIEIVAFEEVLDLVCILSACFILLVN